jgi:AraC-like DNA-binding protein
LLNEIYRTENPLTFEELLARLLAEIETRIRNGNLTERGLARMAGMSQPHVHHILKGKRGMTPRVADQFLRVLGMEASDLLVQETPPPPPGEQTCLLLPLLTGTAGPRSAAPVMSASSLYFPFPSSLLRAPVPAEVAALSQLAVVRAGYDPLLHPFTEEHDLLIVSLLRKTTGAVAAAGPAGVMLWELDGSWLLDAVPESIAARQDRRRTPQADERARQMDIARERLIERRKLLHATARPVAIVHWLLRRMLVSLLRR